MSYIHLHQNKERIRNCHKQTCAKTKKGLGIVLDTQFHQNKEKIRNCLKHTCNKTKTGLEIVLNTLTPKQRKLWKLSQTHLHLNKEPNTSINQMDCWMLYSKWINQKRINRNLYAEA